MCFFRGSSEGIVVLYSSLSSFVVSTRLIRSGSGAIDSPDQSLKVLNNMIHPKSLKCFSLDFVMACRQKILIFGIFKACISKIAYRNFENTKNENVLTSSHRKVAQEFFSRTSDVSYCSKP